MDIAWNSLSFLETEPTARKYLSACYQRLGFEQPDRLAFQQSTRFLLFWKQARLYYETAEAANLSIQPLLLFYGCRHLLKAMLLTRDPFYPQNSRVLQHGVTTRKLKRNAYVFTEDEIRPQKEGFFSHLAHTFRLAPIQDRYRVHELLTSLPGISTVLAAVTDRTPLWVHLTPSCSGAGNQAASSSGSLLTFAFPACTEGPLTYSTETFRQYINRLAPSTFPLDSIQWAAGNAKQLSLPQFALSQLEQHPLFRFQDSSLFFWNGPSDTLPLPEWASHFLLLYLLSMLCRYETEWWGELIFSHDFAERIVVERFLTHHADRFPTVIMKQIEKNNSLILP